MGQKNNKKQKIILISLLTIGLVACNGGGSGGSSSGGDTPAPGPTPTPVYARNGLTMTIKQVSNNDTKVNLAKTFGHTQYYLIITNNNEQSVNWGAIQYDTMYDSTLPLEDNIVKYVMAYDGRVSGVPACLYNSPSSQNNLQPGSSCAYQLNAMWADNQATDKSLFNWKMSYGIKYGSETTYNWVGKDCSMYPNATCATSAEIEAAENNQTLSYYLPNNTNAISSDIGNIFPLTAAAYNTGGSNANVTNMNGDILWIPNATAASGSVSRYELQYNANTNTLTKGAFLNTYTGSNYWLMGGASSNLSGDTFYQYNYANDTNIEPLSVSDMVWTPGLDGSMYASSGNDAYGILKVTPNGDGTYTKTKLPYLFNTSPTKNIVQAVAANGNILTADLNSNANYCYTNTGNNTYTKAKLENSPNPKGQLRGVILAGVQYVVGFSNTITGGTTYLGFDGNALTQQPTIVTKIDMNTCTPDYSGFLVSWSGIQQGDVFGVTNQYALSYGNSVVRVANINTVSNGADGN